MNASPTPGVTAVCRTADEMQLLSAFNGGIALASTGTLYMYMDPGLALGLITG